MPDFTTRYAEPVPVTVRYAARLTGFSLAWFLIFVPLMGIAFGAFTDAPGLGHALWASAPRTGAVLALLGAASASLWLVELRLGPHPAGAVLHDFNAGLTLLAAMRLKELPSVPAAEWIGSVAAMSLFLMAVFFGLRLIARRKPEQTAP